MRVRRHKRPNGSVYHKITFKFRPEALTTKEAKKSLSGAPEKRLEVLHGSYDKASDVVMDGTAIVQLEDYPEHPYIANSRVFTTVGAKMRVVPFTEKESAGEGFVEIDVEEGSGVEEIQKLLNQIDPTFSDRVVRDPTAEEKEVMWLRRLIQYAAPKSGLLLRVAPEEELTLERLRRLASGDYKVFEELFPGKSGPVPDLGYETLSASWGEALSYTKSELVNSTLLKPDTVASYDPELHKGTGTGWHADTLEGAWRKLVNGKPATAVHQGLGYGASNLGTLESILESTFGLSEDASGNSDGGGVRGIMERFFQGKNVKGASTLPDLYTGSGDSTIARIWNQNINTASEGYGAHVAYVIRPDVLDRLDCYVQDGDHYGKAVGGNTRSHTAWTSHEPLDRAAGLSSSNEINFRKGIDHRAIMAVCVPDETHRQKIIERLHARGTHSLNGVPVESFFQGNLTKADIPAKLWPAFGVEAS